MPVLPANALKTRGVRAVEQALAGNTEAIVSVRKKIALLANQNVIHICSFV